MPLHHGKSQKSFSENVGTEMHEGKPLKQSLAIAYAMKRKAAKHHAHGGMHHMAHGEMCEAHGKHECEMCHGGKYADGGFIQEEKASGYHSMPEEHEKHDSMAMDEDKRMLNQHGEHEVGPDAHEFEPEREMHYDHAVENQGFPHEERDLVSRIMKQREHHYSHGGRVANKTHVTADFEPNEFDEMSKDDDLEHHYTGANSGDEIGDDQEDEDRHDIVSRIMKSRHKKDRYPRTGMPGYPGYMD
jgi:hypothetical protein